MYPSPIFFNIYGECRIHGEKDPVSIGGRNFHRRREDYSNLRCADDTTLFASSEKEPAQLFRRLEAESENELDKQLKDKSYANCRISVFKSVKELIYLGRHYYLKRKAETLSYYLTIQTLLFTICSHNY